MPDALPELSPAELSRYSRHILLDEIGVAGQRRLAAARVLVVGAGGLGSPAALYLAAAGVGTLGIADLDKVEDHNLQRQLLHDTQAVGRAKTASAAARLRALNPHIRVQPHDQGVQPDESTTLFSGYDVVIDGTDNFPARYMINDAAFFARKPLVFGSVFKFEGQVAVFDPAHGGPCYRCLFPQPPPPGSIPGCGEAGVIGALCGVIGSLQAMEAIKLVTGIGTPLTGRLLTYDALNVRMETLTVARDPHCPLCGKHPSVHAVRATAPAEDKAERVPAKPAGDFPLEMSAFDASQRLATAAKETLLIDVREPWETEVVHIPGARHIPMREIPERLAELPRDRHLLIMCHHGARSRRVAEYLRTRGLNAVSNVEGGIAAWAEEVDRTLPRY